MQIIQGFTVVADGWTLPVTLGFDAATQWAALANSAWGGGYTVAPVWVSL